MIGGGDLILPKRHNFRSNPRERTRTNRIIYHHSVSGDVSSETIHQWHLQRGWFGIGYHFVIRYDGSIEEGRDINTVGSHAGSPGNPDSIGVCVVGDFTIHKPTKEQIESSVDLNRRLFNFYDSELKIQGHEDFSYTACPGHYFPLSKIRKKSEEEELIVNKTLTWEQEQAIKMIKELAELGEIDSPAIHIDKIKEGKPIGDYVYLTLMTRIRRRMG